MSLFSRRALLGAGLGMASSTSLITAPAIAQSSPKLRWRMVTSWPKNRAGPGISAKRLVENINAMSGGHLQIDLFAAGEIVPALSVFDAVANGTVEMGHSAAIYWQGKMSAAPFFTTVPFGLGPIEHQAWLEFQGGQALWDELYAPHKVRAFMAGNVGPSMGGWFKRKISTAADLKGLRIRMTGLGADIFTKLGAIPMTIPAGDLLPALERGAIDGVEFLAPATDVETGLHAHAPFYYAPGFNKPNGASECLISLSAWEQLSPELRAIVAAACRAEHALGLADAHARNSIALLEITKLNRVSFETFSDEIISAAQRASREIISNIRQSSAVAEKITISYDQALQGSKAWSALSSDMERIITKF
jgi:TRAP-type mannitol/chloroaromatic compound transport system substrate-binding protein